MSKVMEGVFAVNKPPSVSSAGVLRNLQEAFNPSKLFAPWLAAERQRLEDEWSRQPKRGGRQRRKLQNLQVKLGHGGTLDPMATGVLIVGVGSGTKTLNSFLGCTKSYEAVVVFGAATDSYDAWGKVVARAPWEKTVTREKVEEALGKFRGKIMQKPPIFSALKVKGKPLYEYARNGEEIPVEIEERPVEVTQLEMLEWLGPGEHEYPAPMEEAEEGVAAAARKLLDVPAGDNAGGKPSTTPQEHDADSGLKRKREDSTDELVTPSSPEAKRPRESEGEEPTMAGALPAADAPTKPADDASPKQDSDEKATSNGAAGNFADTSAPHRAPAPAPAVRLRMTVSSGFYVRSLAHDLGRAVGSLAYMAALVRTRQGDFALGENVVETGEFEKGEEVWAPKVESLLEEWRGKQQEKSTAPG